MRTTKQPTNGDCGDWAVIGPSEQRAKGKIYWQCRCACGTERWVWGPDLVAGRSTNCGCVRRKKVAERNHMHGEGCTRLHARWLGMIARCNDKNHKAYHRYGGRGIKVCDSWLASFEAFKRDMGEPPTTKHQIDRIDNSKGYGPENCRWATNTENSRNRDGVRMATHDGLTLPLNEWAERVGLPPKTVYARITRYGWTAHRALTTPVMSFSDAGSRASRSTTR